ncbi:MAG: protein kinase, partial [Acidobacteriota bacterium]
EQLRGQPADARSDVWALGAVLYEMATGARPFQGRTGFELSSAILSQPLPLLSGTVPPELAAIIGRCLEKEPEQRYQRAGEVRAALEAIHRGAVAPPETRRYRPVRRRWWLAAGVGAAVVVLVFVFLVFRLTRSEAPPQALTIRPLTSFVGMEWGVTFSPDTSFIAYGHNRYGHMDIFVLPTGGGDPVRLTDNPADELTPRWSPDGRYIAFVSDRGAGTNIYLSPPLPGAERKLVETNIPWLERAIDALFSLGAIPWSPDANELLFSRLEPSGEIAIWKVNLRTGAETRVTKPPPGALDLYASWSFDGKRIVFTRGTSLWLMDAQGEPEQLLGDQYLNTEPAWSPDSQRVVFHSNRGGRMNLWEIEIRSRRLRQLTTESGNAILPTVSPTGRIAYTSYSHQVDIYWGQVDRPQEEHQRLTSHTFNHFGARVSPDGQQVLYQSDRTGNYELWLHDRRTGAERQLTDHPATDVMADWSPDGKQIVFLSGREGSVQVWVLEVESGRVRRLSQRSRSISFEPHFSEPRWSPDGKAIGFFGAGEKGETFWVVDPQGGNESSPLSGVVGFDWYRDSRHLLYTRPAADGSGVLEMRVADIETGKEVLLLRGPSAEMVVSRDGRGVAFLHSVSHFNMQLTLLRLAPPASPDGLPRPLGKLQQLTHGGSTFHVHNGGWSPDGKAIVYTRDHDSGDVYVIQNYR